MYPPRRGRRRRRAGHRRRSRPRGNRALNGLSVRVSSSDELDAPLGLLEEVLRGGDRTPESLRTHLRSAVERGDVEVIAAWVKEEGGEDLAGVVVVAYHLSVSAGGLFASVEELQVSTRLRGQGIGRALLAAAGERCAARGVSYVEVQTDEEAAAFYAAADFEREPEVLVMSHTYPVSASRETEDRP